MPGQKALTDYYDILGIPKNATQKGIQRAFRDLARVHHPDVAKDPNSEELFKTMVEAYLVLKDPDKRNLLDADIISEFCKTVSTSRHLGKSRKKKAPPEFLRLLRGMRKR
ncbi:MAG: DnaJ domain-containing protein [Magnetococcales bacterium]|nr:DnaJ domain-containing protein [Magnetococcales bacterium]